MLACAATKRAMVSKPFLAIHPSVNQARPADEGVRTASGRPHRTAPLKNEGPETSPSAYHPCKAGTSAERPKPSTVGQLREKGRGGKTGLIGFVVDGWLHVALVLALQVRFGLTATRANGTL